MTVLHVKSGNLAIDESVNILKNNCGPFPLKKVKPNSIIYFQFILFSCSSLSNNNNKKKIYSSLGFWFGYKCQKVNHNQMHTI